MASVDQAFAKVKGAVRDHVEGPLIERLGHAIGYQWRERLLGPVVTVWLLIEQVMAGNVACTTLRHLCGVDASASAYCQARDRLPLELLKKLLAAVCDGWREDPGDRGLWHGHRTYRLDGSDVSMPDTPQLAEHFGYPPNQKPGCGFPVAKLLTLFEAATGFILEMIAVAYGGHDMAYAAAVLDHLRAGDVLVGDRGFCSYSYLALLMRRSIHGVFRMHGRKVVDFTPRRPHRRDGAGPRSRWVESLGVDDQLVEWFKPAVRPKWISQEDFAALPDLIIVRELRYTIERPGFRTRQVTLVTTLTDPVAYPAAQLAALYGRRWQIETDLRHLKITMGMDILKGKSVDVVMKELYAFVIAYNLVRRVMLKAAAAQGVEPDRISFIDALRWLRQAQPGDEPPPLVINPNRPNRAEPRVKKRRAKSFPLMKQPRHQLRQTLINKEHAD